MEPGVAAEAADDSGGPLPVVPSRIAVPKVAGRVDTSAWLLPWQRDELRAMQELRRHSEPIGPIPTACHKVPPQHEKELAEKLLLSGTCVLVSASSIPCDADGNMLLGGLFSVPKNEEWDRMIFDRRPQNSTEPRLCWAQLPSASQLQYVVLEDGEFLRGSGYDIKVYYYNLRQDPGQARHNAVGNIVDPCVVERFGGDPSVPHYLAFNVYGMGDLNACDIAEAVHQNILEASQAFPAESQLHFGDPVPASRTWIGLYLDDYLVIRRTQYRYRRVEGLEDIKLLQRAHAAVDGAGLERAPDKAFQGQVNFKAWGANVWGDAGILEAPTEVRRELQDFVGRLLVLRRCTKHIMQRVLGFFAFAFQFNRPLYANFHDVYRFVDALPEQGICYLPGYIRDELRGAAVLLPYARAHLRWPVSTEIWATDATPTTGGATSTNVPSKLCRALYRKVETRGESVRLTWDPKENLLTTRMVLPQSEIDAVAAGLRWRVTASYSYRQTAHVNLQEARAVVRCLRQYFRNGGKGSCRQIVLNDSQVCVGAMTKGRSSSRRLNWILRQLMCLQIAGRVQLGLVWVSTHANPADYPSRFQSMPPPSPLPSWVVEMMGQKSVSRGKRGGLELFAGSGNLTGAHLALGIPMMDPWDREDGVLFDVCRDEVRELIKNADFVWLAPPCSSFSPLRFWDPDGPLRPVGKPEGDESNPVVAEGNRLWRRALELALWAHQCGVPFTIEHPRNSRAWKLPETQTLLNLPNIKLRTVDMCMYAPRGVSKPNQKPTRLLSTAPWLSSLAKCDHSHEHGEWLRGPSAKAAAAYPRRFCSAVARAYLRWRRAGH